MNTSAYVNQLLRVRSRKAREAVYLSLAREYGQSFAHSVEEQVEAHHQIVENDRAINRGRK